MQECCRPRSSNKIISNFLCDPSRDAICKSDFDISAWNMIKKQNRVMAYPKIQCTYNTTLHIKPVPFLFRNIVLAELSSFITPVFFPVTNGPLLSR